VGEVIPLPLFCFVFGFAVTEYTVMYVDSYTEITDISVGERPEVELLG
jgi:hypothetical protein